MMWLLKWLKPNVQRLELTNNVKGLISALKYRLDFETRWRAAAALGRIGDVQAVDPLIKALNDEKWSVVHAAIRALGELGSKKAVDPLIHCWETTGRQRYWHNDQFAVAMAESLGKIRDQRAMDFLVKLLKNGSEEVESSVFLALYEIGWHSRNDIEKIYYNIHNMTTSGTAMEELIKIGKPAVEYLIKVLRQKGHQHRRERAAMALGRIKDERGISALLGVLEDEKDLDAHRGVVNALGETRSVIAIDALVRSCSCEWDTGLAICALEGLEKIGLPSVKSLVRALESGNTKLRPGQIIRTLARIKGDGDPSDNERLQQEWWERNKGWCGSNQKWDAKWEG